MTSVNDLIAFFNKKLGVLQGRPAEVCSVCGDPGIYGWVDQGKRTAFCERCYPAYLRRTGAPPIVGKAGR